VSNLFSVIYPCLLPSSASLSSFVFLHVSVAFLFCVPHLVVGVPHLVRQDSVSHPSLVGCWVAQPYGGSTLLPTREQWLGV